MPNKATITAKTGPAVQDTSLVVNNVSRMNFDLSRLVLQVTTTDWPNQKEFDLHGVTTATLSISSDVYTVTIS